MHPPMLQQILARVGARESIRKILRGVVVVRAGGHRGGQNNLGLCSQRVSFVRSLLMSLKSFALYATAHESVCVLRGTRAFGRLKDLL